MLMAGPVETIELSGAAAGITPATLAPTTGIFAGKRAKCCLITVEAASVSVGFDGTTATASNGHIFAAGDILPVIESYQVAAKLSAIKVSDAAKLKVTPFFEM